jgi:predicted nucleic acid-binding protein
MVARMVVIDATMLLLMLRPGTPVPPGPDGIRIDRPKDRIEYLLAGLEKDNAKLVIPTPALSEVLVRAGAAASQQIVDELTKWSVFQIFPFDTRAAIEVAAMTRGAMSKGNKRGNSAATWAKIKYDRQIVAIAKVAGATTIYSDDADIRSIAGEAQIEVKGLIDLPLPPASGQGDLFRGIAAREAKIGGSPAQAAPEVDEAG